MHANNDQHDTRTDERIREKWTSGVALADHPALFTPPGAVSGEPAAASSGGATVAANGGMDGGGVSPPWVLRGAKSQGEVGLDWITVTGPKEGLNDVTLHLAKLFGPWTVKAGLGFQRGGSHRFPCGVVVSFDDPEKDMPILRVEVPGDALSQLTHDERLHLLMWLLLGRRCTRLDVRIDVQCPDGHRVGLIDSVLASCKAGELCGARRWKPIMDYDGVEVVGYAVTIGKRGKDGSGRFIRVYDKGLETEERPAGTWERWEVEHSGDVAHEVAMKIALSDQWVHTASAIVLGAVDFRENNGSRELGRRPRMPWWTTVLEGIEPVCVREARQPTTFESNALWLRRTVAPKMKAMAIATGQDLGDVAADLMADVMPHRDGERDAVVAGYVKQVKEFATGT